MSFQNKGFWTTRSGENSADGNASRDNPSRLDPKRSHQWFADASEPHLFPSKKQAVQASNSRSTPDLLNSNTLPWDSNFLSAPAQFVDSLFNEANNAGAADLFNLQKVGINAQYGNGSPVGLSIYHSMDQHPEACLGYGGGSRKVKVSQVKDSNTGLYEHGSEMLVGPDQTRYASMGHDRVEEDENIMLMGHTYRGSSKVKNVNSGFGKGDDDEGVQIGHSYNKEVTNTIYFGDSPEEPGVTGPVQTSETYDEDFGISTEHAIASISPVAKQKPESKTKKKSEPKAAKKEIPNSFPSNVRSLMSTGVLEGVPVKYVSAREELNGIIKGSGYLCGCESCHNSTKALNAYEFERHAGRKTKHPNNHIFFENGKTIYQIVQELKSTPESELFDVMQTITGSPLNQKAFTIWKESFQAAARALHRIYGKADVNM